MLAVVSVAVMPIDAPTVLSAETVSKSRSKAAISGSRTNSVTKQMIITITEPKIVAKARFTDLSVIVRLNIVTLFSSRTVDINDAKATPIVFTLIPPAVDCDAPPIHISIIYSISVSSEKWLILTLLKPAVRGVAALKKLCTSLSVRLIPAKAPFHSVMAMATVPVTSRMIVALTAILVFRFARCGDEKIQFAKEFTKRYYPLSRRLMSRR